MRSRVIVHCMLATILTACGDIYQEEGALQGRPAMQCVLNDRQLGYGSQNFEKMCEGRSLILEGFLVETEDEKYIVNAFENYAPRDRRYDFVAELSRGDAARFDRYDQYRNSYDVEPAGSASRRFRIGDKIRVSGVVTGRTFAGMAEVRAALVEVVELNEREVRNKLTAQSNSENSRKAVEHLRGYALCADAMRAQFGAQCPVPNSGAGLPGRVLDDGMVRITDGICFWGGNTITFSCDYTSPSKIEITSYEVH